MQELSFNMIMLMRLFFVMTMTPICLSSTNLRTEGFGVVNIREKVMNKNYATLPSDSQFVTKFYTDP